MNNRPPVTLEYMTDTMRQATEGKPIQYCTWKDFATADPISWKDWDAANIVNPQRWNWRDLVFRVKLERAPLEIFVPIFQSHHDTKYGAVSLGGCYWYRETAEMHGEGNPSYIRTARFVEQVEGE